jgi:hypothetical protein
MLASVLQITLYAETVSIDVDDQNRSSQWIILPYAFSSDSMGLTGGIVGIANGYVQPQMSIVATAFGGESLEVKDNVGSGNAETKNANSKGIALVVYGYRPSFSKRTFISFYGSYAYYPNQRIYLDGSNDSQKVSPDDPIIDQQLTASPLYTQGYNNWAYMRFRYVLPWGENHDNPITTYRLSKGLPVNRDSYGGGTPFATGRTIVELQPFFTRWTADKLAEEPEWKTTGLRAIFEHDNTDYISSPSRGYGFKLQYSKDFGGSGSTQSWDAFEGKYSHYFELPALKHTRQNVIALNAWSAYSPSWDHGSTLHQNGLIDTHRPPPWEGARLGGWNRLRAYDSNRFSDKAAIYYAMEYRVIPSFNPLKNETWLPVPIDWFQAVLFAEAGRVAPEYDITTLHTAMKSDVGFSIRALAAKIPVRFDMAFGSEGSNMWVMVQHPF